jgi:hypothetical protein
MQLVLLKSRRRARVTVYDVSSRESFEALPRWLEELENYVSPEVVKIVVGNKLDKVSNDPNPFSFRFSLPTPNSQPRDPALTLIAIAIVTFTFPYPSRRLPTDATHAHALPRNTLDKCPRLRPRRSQRARDVFLLRRPPRRR